MDTTTRQDTTDTITRQSNDDDFKIKGAATRARNGGKQKQAPEHCVICLQPITERAVAVPCNHLAFDFVCLVSWLQHRETCPLCQVVITEVQYDWKDVDDYKSYRPESPRLQRTSTRARNELDGDFNPRSSRGVANRNFRSPTEYDPHSPHREDPALAQRRKVYANRLYSLHVGANSLSQYHDFTPQDFASSAVLQSRARMFLRRELKLFTYLDARAGVRNPEFVLEYIVAVLKQCDVKAADGRAEDLLSEFLERGNAKLLLHELHSWLRSPHERLEMWDHEVQYPRGKEGSLVAKVNTND